MKEHGFDGIKKMTKEAIELPKADKAKESVEKLNELHGADVRVASAILTAYDPSRFAVIDWKAWKALYDREKKEEFAPEDYVKYLQDVRKLAEECGMTPRKVDLALWKIGGRIERGLG